MPSSVPFRTRSSACVPARARVRSPFREDRRHHHHYRHHRRLFHACERARALSRAPSPSLSSPFSLFLLAWQQEIPAGERYSDRRAISVNNVLLLRHGSGWLYTYETSGQACIKAYHNGLPLSRRRSEPGVVRGAEKKKAVRKLVPTCVVGLSTMLAARRDRPGGPVAAVVDMPT